MKKCILTFLVFTCIGISDSMSQNNKGTFTLGYGCSLLGDVAIAPYNKGMMDNGLSKTTSITGVLKKDFSVSLISLYFQMNTLLKEFNANTSLSFNASPGIRCSVGNYGFGSANMPITINFNKGMLSSFNSDATTGVTFGIGANILTSTLFNLGDKEFNPFIYAEEVMAKVFFENTVFPLTWSSALAGGCIILPMDKLPLE